MAQTQLIAQYGYTPETHHVTTDDGYILGLHRIRTVGGQPVLLMHGILDSSATWVLNGPKSGLGISSDFYLLYSMLDRYSYTGSIRSVHFI